MKIFEITAGPVNFVDGQLPGAEGEVVGTGGGRIQLKTPDGSIKFLDPNQIDTGAQITQAPNKGNIEKAEFVRQIDLDTVEIAISGFGRPRTLVHVPISSIEQGEAQQ